MEDRCAWFMVGTEKEEIKELRFSVQIKSYISAISKKSCNLTVSKKVEAPAVNFLHLSLIK